MAKFTKVDTLRPEDDGEGKCGICGVKIVYKELLDDDDQPQRMPVHVAASAQERHDSFNAHFDVVELEEMLQAGT